VKIFIDTADIDEIRQACSWGVIDGATTNPSLIKAAIDKRGGEITMAEYIQEILRIIPGPVSLEVIALKADEMTEQARLLYGKFSPYGEVVIKIPINPSIGNDSFSFDGLKAIRQISKDKIPTNATLIMTPEQALLAAKAGATYASPFAGRVDDHIRENLGMKKGVDFEKDDYFDYELLKRIVEEKLRENMKEHGSILESYLDEKVRNIVKLGQDNGVLSGVDLVIRIMRIYQNYGYKTKVIAASIRNARQVREMAELGVDIATLPFNVIKEMVQHHKTLEGVRNFTADVVPAYEDLFKQK